MSSAGVLNFKDQLSTITKNSDESLYCVGGRSGGVKLAVDFADKTQSFSLLAVLKILSRSVEGGLVETLDLRRAGRQRVNLDFTAVDACFHPSTANRSTLLTLAGGYSRSYTGCHCVCAFY